MKTIELEYKHEIVKITYKKGVLYYNYKITNITYGKRVFKGVKILTYIQNDNQAEKYIRNNIDDIMLSCFENIPDLNEEEECKYEENKSIKNQLIKQMIKEIVEYDANIIIKPICEFHQYRNCIDIILENWEEELKSLPPSDVKKILQSDLKILKDLNKE